MTTKNLSLKAKIFSSFILLSVCFLSIEVPKAQAFCIGTTSFLGFGTDTCLPLIEASTGIASVSAPAAAASGATGAAAGVANAGTSVANFSWDAIGKNTLDYIAYAAAQKLLTKLTQNTIAWIRGGFHGSPSFAVDTNEIFTEIADNIAGGMVLSLRNIAVCEFTLSYKADLMETVDLSAKKRPYLYNQKAKCPFREDYGFKASEFYADFANGGWSLMGAALNDGGNPYGLQLVTAKEQAAREADAMATKDKKLGWSNGFTDIIDTTSCNYPSEIFYYEGAPDPDGSGLPLSQWQASQKNAELMSDPARVKALQNAYCKTTTPGKVVGDQLTKTLGVDMDRIGFSDNMNKIVAAFLDVVTQKTVRSVFGKDSSTAGGGKAPTPATEAPPVIAITTSPVVGITKDSSILKGFLTSAPFDSRVRVWFVLGESSGVGEFLAVPITAQNSGQFLSLSVKKLKPNTTYWVNTVATTGNKMYGVSPSTELRGIETSFRTLSQQTSTSTTPN